MDRSLGIWFEHHGGIMFNDNGSCLQCSPGVVVFAAVEWLP